MMMMDTATDEHVKLIGKIRLKTVEKAFIPSTPSPSLKFGDRVLVYRWTTVRWEPKAFVSRDETTIIVMDKSEEHWRYAKTNAREFKEGTYLPTPGLYEIPEDTKLIEDKSEPEKLEHINLPDEFKIRIDEPNNVKPIAEALQVDMVSEIQLNIMIQTLMKYTQQ